MELTYEQNKAAINLKCHKELPFLSKVLCFIFRQSVNAVCCKVISRQYERGFLTSVQWHESQEIKNTIITGENPQTK